MARKPQDVTDAELAILEVLWASGPQSIRRISEIVYPDDAPAQYATVKRLLARLEAKGHVRRNRGTSPLTFAAVTSREDLVGRRLEALSQQLCEGSLAPVLMHAARSDRLTKKQRQVLLDLIDELDPSPARRADKQT